MWIGRHGSPTPPIPAHPAALRTPGSAGAGHPRRTLQRRLQRLALLAVLMGSLAVFLDRELQRRVDSALHALGLTHVTLPPHLQQHGEL